MKLRIRELRIAQGLTQERLAGKAGLSRSYLTELENGSKAANTYRLEALARALSVQPQHLFEKPDSDNGLNELIDNYLALPASLQKALIDISTAMRTVGGAEANQAL